MRDGLSGLLRSDPGFLVVGQFDAGAPALQALPELRPDLLVVDLRLPDMDGLHVLSGARRQMAAVRLVVLSAFVSEDDLLAAARAGAQAYLTKTVPAAVFLETLHLVMAGENVLKNNLSPALRARLHERDLTPKERLVLTLLGRGLTNKEISENTGLSENTVKTHVRSVFQKLSVSNRSEATAIALRRGLVE